LLDDELGDGRVTHERLGDVYTKWTVGEVAHRADLVTYRIKFTGRRFDDAAGTGGRHR